MPAGGVHPRGNGGQSPGSGLPSSPWVELLPAWIDHDAWVCLLKDKAPHSRGFLLHVTEAENAGGTVKCHPRQPEYDPSGASYPIPPAHSSKCQLFQIRCYLINANFFHGKTSDFTVQWLLGSWRSAAHLNSAGCLIYRQRVYRQLLLSPFSALGSLSHGGAGPGGRWPRPVSSGLSARSLPRVRCRNPGNGWSLHGRGAAAPTAQQDPAGPMNVTAHPAWDAHCATPCVVTGQAHVDRTCLNIPGPENATSPPPSALALPGIRLPGQEGQQVHRGWAGRSEAAWPPPGGPESRASGPSPPSLKQSSLPGRSGFQQLILSNMFRNDLKSQKSRASLAEMHNEWPVSRSGDYMVDKGTNDGQTARDEPAAGAGGYPWTWGRGVLVPWCH